MFDVSLPITASTDAADGGVSLPHVPAAAVPEVAPVAVAETLPSGPSFADLGIIAPLLDALKRLNITHPTPVQAQAVPVLLAGRDLISSAPTGTGKTAAFLLPSLQRLVLSATKAAPAAGSEGESRQSAATPAVKGGRRSFGARVLVLTPTRELAQQVAKHAQALSRTLPRMTTVCVTGGESYFLQNKLLSSPHEILVATPGRLMDQMDQGRVDLSRVEVLILDEADRMLDMGFADDVVAISKALPTERQTMCFTATLSRAVRTLASQLLRDPEWMEVTRIQSDEAPIDDHVVYVDNSHHRDKVLLKCLSDTGLGQAIVFTATKRHAEQLAGELFRAGIAAQALHGDLGQRDRTKALNRLRRGECKVLVATDVAARGLDVSTITHVINYDLPRVAEDYVHRIGRTGRAGSSGQALSLVGREDIITLRKIEHFIGRKVQVSEFEGLEAEFKPVERRHRDAKPGGSFRKPSYANGAGKKPWTSGRAGPGAPRSAGADGARHGREGGYRGRDGGSAGGARAGKGGYAGR
jgi:superfamily II DNA/RNA helicase